MAAIKVLYKFITESFPPKKERFAPPIINHRRTEPEQDCRSNVQNGELAYKEECRKNGNSKRYA